jgi:septal ring factor EnvC (AmiA/AmiB activator)
MREKSRLVAELRKAKDSQISQLQDLRHKSSASDSLEYAFFERRGTLKVPVDGKLSREYGTFVDPQFRFRLMNKGNFYSAPKSQPVAAVFGGQVALATKIPGYGQCVILDHGDNYYSVYAFASQLKVREGRSVKEGDIIALSGEESSLFGPGLYFEIRHFTDAIDPRPWIKEPGIKTAQGR